MNRKIAALLFVVGLLATFSAAQSNPEKTPSTAPTGLALEITFIKTNPPAYSSVRENGDNGGGWFSLFGRVPNVQKPDAPPVNAVNIIHRLEKDAIKITVSIFKGHKFRDQEIAVADFSMRENERISIKELTAFGVEPFEIHVVRVAPTASALPSIVNKTDSLQVTGVEPIFSTLPAYKITLLNTSDKAVSAFAFETVAHNGRKLVSAMPQGFEGASLIEPGATFEKEIPNDLQNVKTTDSQPPPVQPNQSFVILAAVFEDGSYEGDALTAARFRGFTLGRKSQLKKMLDFSPENLEKQTANLKFAPDENAFADLLKEFPALNEKDKASLRISVEVAARGVERNFLQALEKKRNQDPKALRVWLTTVNEIHRKWLARLR